MHTRIELHTALKNALGSNNVYFAPPEGLRMNYPAIVYKERTINVKHAGSIPYIHRTMYDIIVISSDPDNAICKRVSQIPTVNPGTRYIVDNLYHDPFTIYI